MKEMPTQHGQDRQPDIKTPLPNLSVEVSHDLGGADVLLLDQLAHLQTRYIVFLFYILLL